jgi:hypothetical protein
MACDITIMSLEMRNESNRPAVISGNSFDMHGRLIDMADTIYSTMNIPFPGWHLHDQVTNSATPEHGKKAAQLLFAVPPELRHVSAT